MKRCLQQMPRKQRATVRHRINKCLSPIPRGMKSHREPQAARALQRQTKEQSNQRRRQQARPALAFIQAVTPPEIPREQNRRRPETNPAGKRELQITAKVKVLEQPHKQEIERPERRKLDAAHSVD